MRLKDQIAADIEGVFLNLDEHADEIDFDGTRIKAVIDETRAEPLSGFVRTQRGRPEGIFGRSVVLYAAAADIPSPPLNGDRIKLNGETWTVGKVTPEGGMLVIELGAIDS